MMNNLHIKMTLIVHTRVIKGEMIDSTWISTTIFIWWTLKFFLYHNVQQVDLPVVMNCKLFNS
jgi:hypothetical protein